MEIYNSSMVTNVVRAGDSIGVEAALISTDEEAVARICCGVRDLVVESGGYEIFRSPEYESGFGDLSALAGTQAYLGNGAAIRKALSDCVPIVQELVFECVRAVVQAETFFITERGYADNDAYDRFWEETYSGSCLLYEKPNHAETWMGYVGNHERRRNLNNRVQNVSVFKDEAGYKVSAAFIESFHEISICLSAGLDGIVNGASAGFIRAPGEICKQTAELISGLDGLPLPELSKKEIAGIVGGCAGCTHLTDLAFRASSILSRCILSWS